MTNPATRIVMGITGASGAPYAVALLRGLLDGGAHVDLVVSPHGRQLLLDELDIRQVSPEALLGVAHPHLAIHNYNDLHSAVASGSTRTKGMVICPCSGNSLGQVAAGLGGNLLARAAQVTLKEHRRLILVPREMPLSQLDLENCLRLSRAGAIICPAAPGFYLQPQKISDLVDFVVGKILDLLDVPHQLPVRWEGMAAPRPAPAEEGP